MRYGVPSLSYTEKFESNLYFLMPKEKVEEIRERIVKKLIEVNRRLQQPLFSSFYGAPPRAPRRGPPVMWTKEGGLIRLQVHHYRNSLTGIITPVRKNCGEVPAGVGSSDLFATQRDDLCYHLHVVYPGRYYSCGSVPVGLYLWRVRLI